MNCSINENSVFSKPKFRKLFEDFIVVKIYTDRVPNEYYAPEPRAKFGTDLSRQTEDAREVNFIFQRDVFETAQLPLYAILDVQEDGRIVILGTYDEGRIIDEDGFERFLRDTR